MTGLSGDAVGHPRRARSIPRTPPPGDGSWRGFGWGDDSGRHPFPTYPQPAVPTVTDALEHHP